MVWYIGKLYPVIRGRTKTRDNLMADKDRRDDVLKDLDKEGYVSH
jgi:hypothetical protein